MHRLYVFLILSLVPLVSHADLDIFTCEPDWAALAEELGGDLVETNSATTAFQDPHYIQARPSLIAKVRNADLLVCSGASLEIGWLPVLLRKANNADVMPGTPGYFEASMFVQRLGVPSSLDRAQGDIHPQGNPHIQTDPHNMMLVGRALTERMAKLDPANAAAYQRNFDDFKARFTKAIAEWEKRAAPLQSTPVITHHKAWIYLERWLGLEEVANLEPIPGLPPTAGHLSELVSEFSDGGAKVIIRAPFQDDRASEWLTERTGIPAIVLPLSVGGTDAATDLFTFYGDIIDRLLEATQ